MPTVDQIVQTTVTRTSVNATLPGFGTPVVLAQFAGGTKGFGATQRTATYTSTAAMLTAGWLATDSVYLWASSVFAQSPRVKKIMVGRIDSGDASVAASGDAIRAESDDWYAFEVVGNRSIVFTLSTALITGNSIASTINGTTVATTVFATDHATTMNTWKTNIQAAISGATATVSGNTMTVTFVGKDLNAGTCAITLGASQPTVAITFPLDATKSKAWMAWTEQQKKMVFFQDSDPAQYAANTGNSGTATLGEYAMLTNYQRTVVCYHGASLASEYLVAAYLGDQLPYDPGKSDWAFKTLTGISTETLTTTQDDLIRAKNVNVYVLIAGIASTYAGTVAKTGQFIDDQRFIDWMDTQIKLDYMNLRASNLKIPRDKVGYQMVEGTLKATGAKGVTAGGIVDGTYTVTMPLPSAASPSDIATRTISGIVVNYTLSGSVNNIAVAVNVAG